MYRDYRIGSVEDSRSHILKKKIKHIDHLHTSKSSFATFTTITTQKHVVKTQEGNKLCLSIFYDERYILPDGVSTFAYGHFRIPGLNAKAKKITIMIANLYIVLNGNQEVNTDTTLVNYNYCGVITFIENVLV